MSHAGDPIPYEKQADTPGNALCGAASLCMVYRSLGVDCSQAEVWEQVAPTYGSVKRARTYRLAADALKRGLAALVVQARAPWETLQRCAAAGVRVILSQRVNARSAAGHYTVLTSIDDQAATLHDPQVGPEQRFDKDALLSLWQPIHYSAEVAGNVLVAVGSCSTPAAPCPRCNETIPPLMKCPGCAKDLALQPAVVLGCPGADCPERLWKHLYCPHCDRRVATIPTG